jgi:small redox-active disulfide protein 2
MKVEVLGMGCARCDRLEQQVHDALNELKVDAEVVKVSDLNKISSYGVLMTPGLVINGKVYSSGKVPDMVTLRKWIGKETGKDIKRQG